MTTQTLTRVQTDPQSAIEYAVQTSGLQKSYAGRIVVDDVDLHLPTGVVSGFVGPNGAGKTTTIRMLLGLVRPTAGSGQVLGQQSHSAGGVSTKTGIGRSVLAW